MVTNDNGAETTIITASIVKDILKKSKACATSLFEVSQLDEPMEIELAVRDEPIPKVTVSRELRAPMNIFVPGNNLPLYFN